MLVVHTVRNPTLYYGSMFPIEQGREGAETLPCMELYGDPPCPTTIVASIRRPAYPIFSVDLIRDRNECVLVVHPDKTRHMLL